MQPEQYPAPAPTPAPDNDWLNNYQPAKKSAPVQRILLIVAIVGGVLGVLLLLITSLTGGESVEAQMRKTAAAQQEILRLAEVGLDTKNATTPTYNLAATISTVGGSNLQQLTSVTGEVSKEELALVADSAVDTELQTAAQTNSFDATFPKVMKNEITQLNSSLTAIYDQAKNEKLRIILSQAYENNKALLVAINDSTKP